MGYAMKSTAAIAIAVLLALPNLSNAQAQAPARTAKSAPTYLDTTRSFEERATDLVSRLTLEEKAALMQHDNPAIPRLGIAAYDWWNEALHGVARAGDATSFPQAIGLAATFNIPLMDELSKTISDEARAKHHEAL